MLHYIINAKPCYTMLNFFTVHSTILIYTIILTTAVLYYSIETPAFSGINILIN